MSKPIKKSRKTKSNYPSKFKLGEAVAFDPPKWNVEDYPDHPLKRNEIVYFLTKIPNVHGHCIVATYEGKVIPMIHPGDLRKVKDSEL